MPVNGAARAARPSRQPGGGCPRVVGRSFGTSGGVKDRGCQSSPRVRQRRPVSDSSGAARRSKQHHGTPPGARPAGTCSAVGQASAGRRGPLSLREPPTRGQPLQSPAYQRSSAPNNGVPSAGEVIQVPESAPAPGVGQQVRCRSCRRTPRKKICNAILINRCFGWWAQRAHDPTSVLVMRTLGVRRTTVAAAPPAGASGAAAPCSGRVCQIGRNSPVKPRAVRHPGGEVRTSVPTAALRASPPPSMALRAQEALC